MTLMRAEEVAETLGVSQARVYELVRRGIIPAVRIGRQVRFSPSQLESWIEGGGRQDAGSSDR